MTAPAASFEPRPAYPELLTLASAMRPEWNPDELRDAMTAAHQAGWAWTAVFREVVRLILREDETPVTLRNSARRPVPAQSSGPEVNARGLALALAAIDEKRRTTGGQPVLTEDNDPKADAASATEAPAGCRDNPRE